MFFLLFCSLLFLAIITEISYSTNKDTKLEKARGELLTVYICVSHSLPYNKNALAVEQLEESKSNIYRYDGA